MSGVCQVRLIVMVFFVTLWCLHLPLSAALSPSQGVCRGSPFLGDASNFPSEVFTGPAEIPASVLLKLMSLRDPWEML